MSSRKLSGAQNRKRKASLEKETAKHAGSFLKYLKPSISEAEPVQDAGELTEHADKSEDQQKNQDNNTAAVGELSELTNEVTEHVDEEENQQGDQVKNNIGDNVEAELNSEISFFNDIGNWQLPLSDDFRVELIRRGPDVLRYIEGPFAEKERISMDGKTVKRSLNKKWFFSELPCGTRLMRSWLVYSPVKEGLFCFCCTLFSKVRTEKKFVSDAFQDWWKLNPKINEHEHSAEHKKNFYSWKTLVMSLNAGKTLDDGIQNQLEQEKKRWRDVLSRILDVILLLAKQNLAFREHRENGNFLEILKLLSKYDPVLREHFLSIEKAKTSYLSPQTQNEFIDLLGNHVRQSILDDVKDAKFYSIITDTSPDISQTDQMSQILRYVKVTNDDVQVLESFIDFLPVREFKTSENISEIILAKLKKDGLDFNNCRGQGYDNAANMAGIHTGVQKRLLTLNDKAVFIPCSNHCLNLAGVHSVSVTTSSVRFFSTVEELYKFFHSSTIRWEILKQHTSSNLQRPSDTRWSANHHSVDVLAQKFEQVLAALDALQNNEFSADTHGAAANLQKSLLSFHFIGFLNLWKRVLPEINKTQEYLQTSGLCLSQCTAAVKALKHFITENRDSLVNSSIDETKSICEEQDIQIECRIRRKKKMPGELGEDSGLDSLNSLKREMFEATDQLREEIFSRSKQMENIASIFAILEHKYITNQVPLDELEPLAARISVKYDELNKDELIEEVSRLRRFLKNVPASDQPNHTQIDILRFICKWRLTELLPNLYVALRLFLTISVSVASCERSFSKLKIIKSYLRSTMSDTRLSNLAILSIERERAEKIDFNDIMTNFASLKSRKGNI